MSSSSYTPGQPEARPAGPELAQTLIFDVTQDQITMTADTLAKIRPAYGPLIGFYSQVFAAQAVSRSHINLAPIVIDDQLLALKQENQMPLVSPDQFNIDLKEAQRLIQEICSLAVSHAPKLAQAGEHLAGLLAGDDPNARRPDLNALFSALLNGEDITEMADQYGMDTDALSFFGFSAMAPSVQVCAAQLAVYLKETPAVPKSYCPVCGSLPDLAFLDESGRRLACCSLCNHIWQVPRMGCLFCDSNAPEDHQYFFSKEEPEFRVYCCARCRHYVKTVDTRQMVRRFFPRLEQVTTLHLDIQAREKGYVRPGDDVSPSGP
ncbi:MAG: formate dehydrogenase accessory protein FdhE [Desulfobacter sp.]